MYAYLTKGGWFFSRKWKWRRKYKQSIRVQANNNYHMTEFHFFDKQEEEIKL
jgi:ribonuclease G